MQSTYKAEDASMAGLSMYIGLVGRLVVGYK